MKLRVNYVAKFSNGTVKTGVTNNLVRRTKELERHARAEGFELLKIGAAPKCSSATAFKIEAAACRILSHSSPGPSREWFSPRSQDSDLYNFICQTIGMFWQMNNCPGSAYEFRELPR